MDPVPEQQDNWVPDLRTLRWAAAQVDADVLAAAIAHDVPRRTDVPAGLTQELWRAAADAAYEATWWPVLQAAQRLRGAPGQPTKG
ncbi:hypothetical protein [Salinispora mooreana]|uniref:hypothetical protein n=1 Tax=Salinispora mooreana TaxID=999545 RepID=UPI000375D6AC|nr:hypothetical protein [Salinispora mooreana]